MPAGSLNIELCLRSGRAADVRITSTRPDAATRVLLGKTPEQVLTVVPLLFTLCGNAQAYAAVQVCRTALGLPSEPAMDAAREWLVQVETLREHAWRILLDWPSFIGLAPDKTHLAAWLKFDTQFRQLLFQDGRAFRLDSRLAPDKAGLTRLLADLSALIDTAIFAGRQAEFHALQTETQLQNWLVQNPAIAARLPDFLYRQEWAAIGQNPITCLPEIDGQALERQIRNEEWAAFVRTPHWQGHCFETTLLNRQLGWPLIGVLHGQYGNGLIVRLLARLAEVANIPARLNQLWAQINDGAVLPVDCSISDGIALAQVQAARGLLIHRLVLRQGTVYDYRIVAPTEWNFHPEGVVVQGLRRLQAQNPDNLRQQAQLLVNAIDPCVAIHLKID
ncbi:MAG: Ni,Fe-hydrogenase I large subunit [Methylovulum sp.]|uniref:Ni,Fe-hydrogenase I large subunit n=1 Tax=Methylovulum sp. TaxID=1916980 RepID=UPI0026252538|nr:Ni,Fe-hydrogenase I large subunit [Methylovulum sp.]MDD2724423.1 Ni,Fe-hydrogenase I large subunit [Methylovulum sp.]MDD5123992.1 Ni,Fe-hydrogenase I large subunit [Methylovulum sp.]